MKLRKWKFFLNLSALVSNKKGKFLHGFYCLSFLCWSLQVFFSFEIVLKFHTKNSSRWMSKKKVVSADNGIWRCREMIIHVKGKAMRMKNLNKIIQILPILLVNPFFSYCAKRKKFLKLFTCHVKHGSVVYLFSFKKKLEQNRNQNLNSRKKWSPWTL